MAKHKHLIIGLLALVVAIILCLVLLFRDSAELISGRVADEILAKSLVSNVSSDGEYVYFSANGKAYKVYANADSIQSFSYNTPIVAKNSNVFSNALSDIGIIVVLLLGFAVLAQVFRLMFAKPKSAESRQTLNKLESSRDVGFESPLLDSSYAPQTSHIKFSDVAGISEVKEELLEIIDYLKNPKRYQERGIALPKGVLLVGPPGVGKTMIAKAVAGEAGVPFFYQSGANFVQIYVGMGAKRVRELFLRAKAKSPSIIFIDEIDAVGKARGNARSDEREATLNQLLTEMDGFEDSSGVIVIAATNNIDVLDSALLRSGRFDRRIYVELPNLEERARILELYLSDKKHSVDVLDIARLSVGFSGAALAALVNESAINALRRKSSVIEKADILATKDKVLVGKKKALSLSEDEKAILAIYQGAKALSAYWLEVDFDKIGLISESFNQIDRELVSKSELMGKIKVALAGNIALKLMHNQSFSNAKEDIAHAKAIATQMCEEYGMAERLMSDNSDVAKILDTAEREMQDFISNAKPIITSIANALLEKERLSKEEIKAIFESVNNR